MGVKTNAKKAFKTEHFGRNVINDYPMEPP